MAQINGSNNVQLLQAKSSKQQSVSLSFASQRFSVGVNIGGKLQWTGFAFPLIGINKTSSSFAASCLRKSPTWSSIPLQQFKFALII